MRSFYLGAARKSALVAAILVIACKDPVGPFIPTVSNSPDNFSVQATDLKNVTTTQLFLWDNTGTAATVIQSSSLTRGSGTLTLLDAAGAEVYTKDLSTQGTFQTTNGLAGEWSIHLLLSGVHGTLDVRVQRQ